MASRSANNVRASTTPGPGVTLRTLCPRRLKARGQIAAYADNVHCNSFSSRREERRERRLRPGVRLFRHLFKAFLQRQHFVPLVRQIGVAGAFLLHYGGRRAADEALVGKFFG